MAAGGAVAEPAEEVSSRSTNGCDSEKWQSSEDEGRRTKSKKKFLPDGFLDPLPPQKSSKLPRFSDEMVLRGTQGEPHNEGMVVEDIPSLASKNSFVIASRRAHRATHLDEARILEAASHLLMVREWSVECPRFIAALNKAGVDHLRHLRYIRLDHHLLTALVERWSPETNTFHLPVGEMTVTLQDVAMILGVRIDGFPLVGHPAVGCGRRWLTWPECCDELLGEHPIEDFIYHNPNDPTISAKFKMGQANAKTCLPLRWLKWRFSRHSYEDLEDHELSRHVRAYILYLIGCFLMPDTSGCEVHLQWLPEMEDIHHFSQFSLGGAVLGHLYRELCEATRLGRKTIAGCLHLLQVWAWEHFHVGRPTMYVPSFGDEWGKPLGYRWNESWVREIPNNSISFYRNELDGLQQSQVTWTPYTTEVMNRLPSICLDGSDIWLAKVPLICWVRVEWHLPQRVMRQFKMQQHISLQPMEDGFRRVDARGKVGTDWFIYHKAHRELWDDRRLYVQQHLHVHDESEMALSIYMQWYLSWARPYLIKPPIKLPDTYYPRAPIERGLQNFLFRTRDRLVPLSSGCGVDYATLKQAVDDVVMMSNQVMQAFHLQDYTTNYQWEENGNAIVALVSKDDASSSCTGPNIASSSRCMTDSAQLNRQEATTQQVPSPQPLPNANTMVRHTLP